MENWSWHLYINEESPIEFFNKLAEYFLEDYKGSMWGANIDFIDSEEIEEMAESIKKSLIKSMNEIESKQRKLT